MGKLSWLGKKSVVFGLSLAMAGFAVVAPLAQVANAVVDPSGCSLTGGAVGISVFASDGVTPIGSTSTVSVGETINYQATLYAIPLPEFCSFGGGTWTLTTPDGISHPLGAVTRVGGSGSSIVTSTLVSYIVNATNVSTTTTNHISAMTNYGGGVSNEDANSETPGPTLGTTAVTQVLAAPTISTTASAGGPIGTPVSDSATLSGGSDPTGTVTFNLYAAADTNCTGTPIFTDSGAPLADDSAGSTSFAPTAPGMYHWTAAYSGDANNASATSVCSDETVTITPATPTITTLLSSSTISAGTSVSDSATLTGATADAGGTVTYTTYTDSGCLEGAETAGTKTVASDTVPDSDPLIFSTPGTFYWQASYSGDADNVATTSACTDELLTVNKLPSNVATTISDASGTIGSSILPSDIVTDSATVSGATTTPTGSVDFTFYTSGTCTPDTGSSAGTAPLVDGVANPSNSEGPLSPGSYSFSASYGGDENYNVSSSSCEPFTVTPNPTTISTLLSSSTVSVGTEVYDTSLLSGATPTAGGTVTYTSYSNSSCTVSPEPAGSPVTVTDGIVPSSTPLSFNSAGTFYWQAVYSGDTNNGSSTSACTDEEVMVNTANPTIATTPSAGGVVGASVSDSATVSGGFNPTGDVTFNLYGADDTSCDSAPIFTSTSTLVSDSAASGDFTPTTPGTYHWTASYSGDSNNAMATSVCGDELVTLTTNTSTVMTSIDDASNTNITSAPAEDTVFDTATVTDGETTPTGNVDFTFYDNGTCNSDEGEASAGTVALVSGFASSSAPEGPLAAGSYSFKAHYEGDTTHGAADSSCEVLNVSSTSPTITTQLSSSSISIGAAVNDTANLTGVTADAGGTVTYTAYTDSACTEGAEVAGSPVTVTGGIVPASSPITFKSSGTFYWQAAYSGDTNNGAAMSACESELLTVTAQTPTSTPTMSSVATTVENASGTNITGATSTVGTMIHDHAIVMGTGTPSGDVTFNLYDNATCADEAASSQVVALSSGAADSSVVTPAVGSYSYLVSYTGDDNNQSSVASCEPFNVGTMIATTTPPAPGLISGFKWDDDGVCKNSNQNGYGWNNVAWGSGGNNDCKDPTGQANGVYDPGENKLNGWTIELETASGTVITATTTSNGGNYTFSNLAPGTYSVCEVMQNGWSQTYPGGNGCHSVVVGTSTATAMVTSENFGNIKSKITHDPEDKQGSISGVKFNDKNRDMKQDDGEPGIPGWTIQLETTSGTIIASTVTGAGGGYSFNNLPSGTYLVREVPKAGWKRITKNPAPIVITSGKNVGGISFGNAVKRAGEGNDTYNDDQCNDYGPALHDCTYSTSTNEHTNHCSPNLLP